MIINKMVLSEEEKKERQRISSKKYRDNNKEKINEYYKKNKEKILERVKIYSDNNKERRAERMKEYYQTPNRKKISLITCWKKRGLVSTDYNLLYDNYLASTNCEECGIEYGKFGDGTATHRCMDHCHETGLFRNYLCNICNLKRR